MRIFLTALFIGCLLTAGTATAERQARKKVKSDCKSVITLPNGNFIYKQSAPLRSGGINTPIVGYRVEPTLIMNRNFGRGGVAVYSSNGTKIGSCPWADAHGHSGGRARCTMNTRSLRSAAVRAGGRPTAFIRTSSGVCVQVPDLGRCYGSVKGLCNRIIK